MYQPTGQGMYPPHNMPAVPPKTGPKIMTSEVRKLGLKLNDEKCSSPLHKRFFLISKLGNLELVEKLKL